MDSLSHSHSSQAPAVGQGVGQGVGQSQARVQVQVSFEGNDGSSDRNVLSPCNDENNVQTNFVQMDALERQMNSNQQRNNDNTNNENEQVVNTLNFANLNEMNNSHHSHNLNNNLNTLDNLHTLNNVNNNNDDNDDVHNLSSRLELGSFASSALTADEITDPQGFWIICFVILLGDMCRGIMFPTLWPLVKSLGGTEVTQGYAVASFSLGRILVSPLFGSWSVRHGYRWTLRVSTAVLWVGTLLYTQTVVHVGRPWCLIVAQTVLGLGSGTLGVTRAYVAEITPTRNRTTYLAWITSVQYAGFTVTPVLGALFSQLLDDGKSLQAGFLVLNAYTAPAYFMSILTVVLWFLLSYVFVDRGRFSTGQKKAKLANQTEYASSKVCFGRLTTYDACILGCFLLNIATKGSISSFETMGIRYAESHFDMGSQQAGLVVGVCGTFGVLTLLSMGRVSKVLSDIAMICGGIGVMCLGILSLAVINNNDDDNNNHHAVWRYNLAIGLVYSLGYPLGHTAVMGLFSKIVGRRPQGTLLGWFASAGSLARITFPLMSGYITYHENIETLFLVLTAILACAGFFTIWSRDVLEYLSS